MLISPPDKRIHPPGRDTAAHVSVSCVLHGRELRGSPAENTPRPAAGRLPETGLKQA